MWRNEGTGWGECGVTGRGEGQRGKVEEDRLDVDLLWVAERKGRTTVDEGESVKLLSGRKRGGRGVVNLVQRVKE